MIETTDLKQQLEFHLQILNSVQQSVIVTDKNAKIILWNDFSEKLYGYTQNEAIGKTTIELISPVELVEESHEKVEEISSGKNLISKYLVKNKLGKIFPVSIKISPIYNKENEVIGIVGISEDISEKKEIENQLVKSKKEIEKSEEKYRLLAENSSDVVWLTDLDLNFLYLSPSTLKLFGYTVEERKNILFETLYKPEIIKILKDLLQVSINSYYSTNCNEPKIIEVEGIHKNGYPIYFEIFAKLTIDKNGQITGIQGTSRNIGERKKVESQLIAAKEKAEENEKRVQKERQLLFNVLDVVPAFVYLQNKDYSIAYSNKHFNELFEKPYKKLCYEVMEGRTTPCENCPTFKVFDTHKRENWEWKSPTGKNYIIHDEIFIDSNGSEKVLEFGFDISTLKQTEKVLHEANEQLKKAKENAENNNKINEARLNLIQYSANHTIDEIIEETLNIAEKISNSRIGFFHFVEDDQTNLLLQNWSTGTKKYYCNAQGKGAHYSIDKAGVWVDCVKERKPVIHNNYDELTHKKGLPEGHAALIRELVVPIIYDDNIKAIIGIGNKETEYNQTDVENISLLAYFAWEIIEKKKINEAFILSKEKAEVNEKLLKGIIDNMQDAFFQADLKGCFTFVNPAAIKMYGYSYEELIGKPATELYADNNARNKLISDLQIHDKITDWNGFALRKDGSKFWVSMNVKFMKDKAGNIIGTEGVVRDISERKQMDAMFQDIIDKNPMSIQIVDKDGFTIKTNPAHTHLFGIEPPSSFSIFDELQRIGFADIILRAKNGEIVYFPDTYFNVQNIDSHFPDKPAWVKAVLFPLKDIAGNPERFVFMHEDITGRKQIEAELQKEKEKAEESEQRLFAYINSIPDVICYKDGTGKWLLANNADLELFCLQGVDYFGKTDLELSEFTAEIYKNAFISCMETDEIAWKQKTISNGIEIIPTVKGEKRVYEVSKIPIFYANGERKGLAVIGRDISKLYETQENLITAKEKAEEKQRFANSITEQSPDIIYVFDILNNKNIFINKNLRTLLNYEIGTVPEDSFDLINLLIHPDDNKQFYEYNDLIKNWNTEYIHQFEFRLKDALGHWRWFLGKEKEFIRKNEKIISLIGVVSEITEQKEIENELIKAKEKAEENEEKYKQIFDNTFDFMSIYEVTEDLRFKVITFNPSEEKLIGNIENYQNRYIDECIPLELYNQFKQNYERCINEEKLIVYEENIAFQHINKTFYTQLIPLKNAIGRIHRIIVISRDITENKLLETQLINQNEKLKLLNIDLTIAKEKAEESDRLKTSFLNNMSHEVRTPLNSIVGFSQIMLKPNQTLEKLKKFSEIISSNSEKLIEIISDVIEISQIHSNQINVILSKINIVSILNILTERFKLMAKEKNIDFILKINIPNKNFYIQSDNEKLTKILTHLINNAIKFTITGSVEIMCEIKEEKIHISISDTGIGISDDMITKILEPFRQVETGISRNFGGNGLGLTIAKAYIGLLNGSISLKSEINKGTTIDVLLPVNISKNLKANENESYLINTVLIADDEFDNYQYLLEILKDTNLKFLYAENGQKALDLCRKEKIDLILMDIRMPIMNGHTSAKIIKTLRPELPIIAQTAYAMQNEIEMFIGVFDDYITKPINEKDLIQMVMKYIVIK